MRLPLSLSDRATSRRALLVLESISELIKLDVGEAQRAALISPLRHCCFDLAEDIFRLGRRDPEVGDMRASTVASGPASSETQVFSSRCRSGKGLTSNAGARRHCPRSTCRKP